MKNLVRKSLSFLLINVLGINPDSILYFAYYTNNIRPGHDLSRNGELFLIRKIKRFFVEKRIIVFDVGANKGDYSRLLSREFPMASIYAFEPNFELVEGSNYGLAKVFPIGLGKDKGNANLFFDTNALEEASIYEDVQVLTATENSQFRSLQIAIEELDGFCKEQNIQEIDFLKIDTEGNEFSVLQGARQMLTENRIKIIQFEFNEMNVISRVFLKDFFDLLSPDFEIFRLHKKQLFHLNKYYAHNEIFVWQNLVAVNKKIASEFLHA